MTTSASDITRNPDQRSSPCGGGSRPPAYLTGTVKVAKFHAGLLSVRVMQLVKDRQGLPPGVAGGVAIADIVVSVPEADEHASIAVAVADGLAQLHGAPV